MQKSCVGIFGLRRGFRFQLHSASPETGTRLADYGVVCMMPRFLVANPIPEQQSSIIDPRCHQYAVSPVVRICSRPEPAVCYRWYNFSGEYSQSVTGENEILLEPATK